MKSAEAYGQDAAKMKPGEVQAFMNTCKEREEIRFNEAKQKNSKKLESLQMKDAALNNDLAMRGYISETITKESLMRGAFMLTILLLCSAGEAVFAYWMLGPLQLGFVATIILSITFILIGWEGCDLYIVYLRRTFPEKENLVFLLFGSTCFLLIITVTALGADLRQNLYQVTQTLSTITSEEENLKVIDAFYRRTSGIFSVFMLALSCAVVCISGYTYHDLKHRLLMTIGYFRIHRSLNKVQRAVANIQDNEIALTANLAAFEADFQYGLQMAKLNEGVSKGDPIGAPETAKHQLSHNLAFTIVSPLFLALVVLLFFFLLRGSAKADTIIFLDLSRSSDSVDYTGRESEFQKNIGAVASYIKSQVNPGERIRVIGITEKSFSSPYILLDAQVAIQKGYFNESLSRERVRILQLFRKINVKPSADMTDIIGAIQLASILFPPSDQNKKLIFLSDMRQSTEDIDLESPQIIDTDLFMKSVISRKLVPSLSGTKVWCLGVHSSGKSAGYWNSLKDFWVRYFHHAKAIEPIIFTMERSF